MAGPGSVLTPNELLIHREGARLTGTSGWLIGASLMLFSAVQSLKHNKSQITPVALQIEIITAADSYRRGMTNNT